MAPGTPYDPSSTWNRFATASPFALRPSFPLTVFQPTSNLDTLALGQQASHGDNPVQGREQIAGGS
jgi:hypothetical protein